ncbi:MAG: type II toxin-antitoxin system YafQ family toxin [Lachnospiraceae bacterium]|nr:type II toxin-antitoxin system YafQ family toxin [Lachnospiraceae bacterium]
MLNIRFTGQFKKDFKRVKSQGFSEADSEELKSLIQQLAERKPLEPKYLDHPLKGKGFVGTREFHLKPDLLVVYKICEKDVELLMLRFGSHSELF